MSSQQTEKIYHISIMKSLMKMAMSFQLPIIWFISIFMAKDKSLVWIMANKLAVNAIKLRKMAHGKEKPSMVKGLSLLNPLKKKANSLFMRILQAWLLIKRQSQLFPVKKKTVTLSLLPLLRQELMLAKILNYQIQ